MAYVPVAIGGIALFNELMNQNGQAAQERLEQFRRDEEKKYKEAREKQNNDHKAFMADLEKKQAEADRKVDAVREENRKTLKLKEEEIEKATQKHDETMKQMKKKFDNDYSAAKKIGVEEMRKVENESKTERKKLEEKQETELDSLKQNFETVKEDCAKRIRDAEEKVASVQEERQKFIKNHNEKMLKMEKDHNEEIRGIDAETNRIIRDNEVKNTQRIAQQQETHLQQARDLAATSLVKIETDANRELLTLFEDSLMVKVGSCANELKTILDRKEWEDTEANKYTNLDIAIAHPVHIVTGLIGKTKDDINKFKRLVRESELANADLRRSLNRWSNDLDALMEDRKWKVVTNHLVPAIKSENGLEIERIRGTVDDLHKCVKEKYRELEEKQLALPREYFNALKGTERSRIGH